MILGAFSGYFENFRNILLTALMHDPMRCVVVLPVDCREEPGRRPRLHRGGGAQGAAGRG